MMPPDEGRFESEPPNEKRPPGHEGAQQKEPNPVEEVSGSIVPHPPQQGKRESGQPERQGPRPSSSTWTLHLDDPDAKAALFVALGYKQIQPLWKMVAATTATSQWPKPRTMPNDMPTAAYHGIVGRIVRGVQDQTEAHQAAVLAQFLCGLGTLIGPKPYLPLGGDRHTALFYVAIVGQSSQSRKGTSFTIVRLLLSHIDKVWADTCIRRGLKSGEGLIDALRDESSDGTLPAAQDKRQLFYEQEFAQVLKVMRREGNTLSTVIRGLWDDGTAQSTTLTTPRRTTGAHASIIGHITENELIRVMQEGEAFNGFANRFLWCRIARPRLVTRPLELDLSCVANDLDELARIVKRASQREAVTMSEEGFKHWEPLYLALSEEDESLAGSIAGRGAPYLLRLALIFALLDESEHIDPDHIDAACAFWSYCEESVHAIWGDAKSSLLSDRIWKLLQKRPWGMSRGELQDAFNRKKSKTDLDKAIKALCDRGLVSIEVRPTAGRSMTVYHPNYLDPERQQSGPSDTAPEVNE